MKRDMGMDGRSGRRKGNIGYIWYMSDVSAKRKQAHLEMEDAYKVPALSVAIHYKTYQHC